MKRRIGAVTLAALGIALVATLVFPPSANRGESEGAALAPEADGARPPAIVSSPFEPDAGRSTSVTPAEPRPASRSKAAARVPTTEDERRAFVSGCLDPRRASLATTGPERYQFVLEKLSPEERGRVGPTNDALVWAAARAYVEIDLTINDIIRNYLVTGRAVPCEAHGESLASGMICWQAPNVSDPKAKGTPMEVQFRLDAERHPELVAARTRFAAAMTELRAATAKPPIK